jgi:hypothetical protein
MLQTKIGLVDTTGTVDIETTVGVAAALNVRVTRDRPRFPINQEPLAVCQSHRHAGQRRMDPRPSHETIEMLLDLSGNRLRTSMAIAIVDKEIRDAAGQFEYLVGVCGPFEADPFTYEIYGVSMSDFLTPHFYDFEAAPGVRYSFTGAIGIPRQILRDGYICWIDPISNEVQQILWVNPDKAPIERSLGPADGLSLRGFVECRTHHMVRERRAASRAAAWAKRRTDRSRLEEGTRIRAEHYR